MGCGARGRIGRFGAPLGVRRRGPVEDSDDALDDIVDVGEVAPVPAVVEHVDGAVLEDVASEPEQRHVRAAPWSVDGEEPQAGGGDRVEMAVAVRHQLVRLLGGAIERQRVVDVVPHRERQGPVCAVDRARRCIDEMADAVVPAPLDNIDEADEIGADVRVGVLQRVTDPCLRSQVDDHVGPFSREELRHCRAIGDAGPRVAESVVRRYAIEPRLLEGDVVVRIEVVHADDLVAAFEQSKRDGRSDEAGRTGDKNLHVTDCACFGARASRSTATPATGTGCRRNRPADLEHAG